jgi:hypothetical protein
MLNQELRKRSELIITRGPFSDLNMIKAITFRLMQLRIMDIESPFCYAGLL